ncbi:hypothetical protein R70723_31945 [Paenibacillus sp. FSL R7-0273]|uniref:hypothetical protein n=1 Tax=Paenibacillus sp. FSL R7-0273 TaxID=1536772 RepID=UPI0004F5B703|nr:hypothetical protein [Paenibacillus sp. FSL R7-0273]AIQ49980.1 hypothetical protein R70723_31945 [Paenibacillus sp. FSL R7-0273]OMF90849.1 hypothetical protein BK144_16390 [Paenibacillus sp. FSL R7-0273]
MSIEQQLTKEFKHDSRRSPEGLNNRITAEYRQQVMQQRGVSIMFRKRKTSVYLLTALIVVMLCGFGYAGSRLLYSDEGRLSVSNRTEQQLQFKQEDVVKIRGELEKVKAQLVPGESAVVYLRDFDRTIGESPIIYGINNPVKVPAEEWRMLLQQQGVQEKLPETLLGAYSLEEGMEASPFQVALGTGADSIFDELKTEGTASGSEMLWRLTDTANGFIDTYTSLYRNAANDTIYVTWQIAGEDVNPAILQLSPPGITAEDATIGGLTAHYLKNDQSLFGQSSIHQDVTWVSEAGDTAVAYHVQTDSAAVTKEQLIEAAESLVQK